MSVTRPGRAARQARRARRLAAIDREMPNLAIADRQSGGALRDELRRLETERAALRRRLGVTVAPSGDDAA